eukprot:5980578-Lingulodinium_polyedra.AAC.1
MMPARGGAAPSSCCPGPAGKLIVSVARGDLAPFVKGYCPPQIQVFHCTRRGRLHCRQLHLGRGC